jgi:hypothetical protein
MILRAIVNDLTWTPYGIQCADYKTAHIVHKFLREAVLDRHIYVSKIIGFTVNSNNTFRTHSGMSIARHKQLGESYPEIMVNLLDKVFLDSTSDFLDTLLVAGMNTVVDQPFGDLRDYKAKTLYTNPNICRCLDKEAVFRVHVKYDCGYKSMAENSKSLSKEFFPCYTDYSLADYVRVLPLTPGESLVPIRYYNGADIQTLKDILTKWFIYKQESGLKKEELLWMQSFTL